MVPPSLRQQLFRQNTEPYDTITGMPIQPNYALTDEILISDETEHIMKKQQSMLAAANSDIKPIRGGAGSVEDDLYASKTPGSSQSMNMQTTTPFQTSSKVKRLQDIQRRAAQNNNFQTHIDSNN